MTSPHFVRGLQAYLDHWLAKTANLDDIAIRQLNPDFPNLLQIVELGLVLPETQEKTANLILQCFFWVEQVGYMQLWQPLVELAVQRLSDHPNMQFRLLKQLGQLQRLQYQLDTAVTTFEQAEQIACALADKQALAEIHMNFCQVYHLKRAYKKAEEYGRLALHHLAEHQLKLKAIAWRTLGIMSQEQGDPQQAEIQLQISLQFATSLKEQALTLNVLAVLFQQQEQYDQALAIYNKLLILLNEESNTQLFAEIQLNKGSLFYGLGRLDEAEVVFKTVIEHLQQRSGSLYYKALAANNLGCIWRDQKRFTAAEASFRRSIQQFSKIGADVYQANAWGNLAKLYAQQGQQLEAVACYDEALKLVASYSNNAFAQKLQTNYTRLRHELKWPD